MNTSNTNIIKPNILVIPDDDARARGMSTTSLKTTSLSPTSSLKYKTMNETNSIINDSIGMGGSLNNPNITYVDEDSSNGNSRAHDEVSPKNKYVDNDGYDYRSYDDDQNKHTFPSNTTSSNGSSNKYDTAPSNNSYSHSNNYNSSNYNNYNSNYSNSNPASNYSSNPANTYSSNPASTYSSNPASTYSNSNSYNNSSYGNSFTNPATNANLGGYCERHSLEACILCSLTNKNSNSSEWRPYGNPNPIPSPNSYSGNGSMMGNHQPSPGWTNPNNSANSSKYNSPMDVYQSQRPNPSSSPMIESMYTKAIYSPKQSLTKNHMPSSLLSSSSMASLGSVGSIASTDFTSSLIGDDTCHVHGLSSCLLCSMNNTYNGRRLNT